MTTELFQGGRAGATGHLVLRQIQQDLTKCDISEEVFSK